MAIEVSGKLVASGRQFAIVAGRFNNAIVSKLVSGALDAIERTGGSAAQTEVVWVPGAFEIAAAAARLATRGNIDGIICLGAVIRGAAPHFDYVASAASRGIADVAARSSVPVIFGVLTCDTILQATERAGTKAGNKGFEAAMAAIEMADLFAILGEGSR